MTTRRISMTPSCILDMSGVALVLPDGQLGEIRMKATHTDGESVEELKAEIARLQGQVEGLLKGMTALQQVPHTPTPVGHDNPPPNLQPESIARLLTQKQNAVLQLLHRGFKNQDIADVMEVTLSTAKIHVRSIMVKLERGTRAQVVLATAPLMDVDADRYKTLTGIPIDWHADPDKYPLITRTLRKKLRGA